MRLRRVKEAISETILITGTSSGLGKDAAQTLVKAGHRVFGKMWRSPAATAG